MVRHRPVELFTREEIRSLSQKRSFTGLLLVAHCWATILLIWTLAVVFPHPLVWFLAIPLIGARQLGLAVLNHEGAHYLLCRDRKLNDWISDWVLNRPLFGASVEPYRRYHFKHHQNTQQKNDPDLPLSSPFPISRTSLMRKVWRDISGQTGWKQRSELVKGILFKDGSFRPGYAAGRLGPNLAINMVFFGGFFLTGYWYLYFLLWVLPNLTWLQLITRIRNIGEHAAVPDDNDRLRNTRTTRAGFLERLVIAPYWVNYHLEHHLLVSCPCYRLPEAHRLLLDKGYGPQMEIKPGYLSMLKHATNLNAASPATG